MRFRLPPWLFVILLAIAVGGLFYGIDRYRHRFVRDASDLLGLLPAKNDVIFFADVNTLRRTGFLRLLTGTKPAEEKDYDAFVRETGLDYTKDLDTLAGAAEDQQLFFALRGRFDWDRLRSYAIAHGGTCGREMCETVTSRPERWASFLRVQPDVIGLAVSPNRAAAGALLPPAKSSRQAPTNDPIWLSISPNVLGRASTFVAGASLFTQALGPAESVVLSLAGAGGDSRNTFEVRLRASFRNDASATAARNQLQLDTKLLKLELGRERQRPNPGDLTGLLTSGSFEAVNRQVIGTWPVRKELLASLQ